MTDIQFLEVLKICMEWYDVKTIAHCARVVKNLEKDMLFEFLPEENQNDLKALAICHDLLEDTKIVNSEDFNRIIELGVSMPKLKILTRNKNDSYDKYIQMCLSNPDTRIVKCADMRDHLSQKDMLTPQLKDKYDKVAYLFFENLNNWN